MWVCSLQGHPDSFEAAGEVILITTIEALGSEGGEGRWQPSEVPHDTPTSPHGYLAC